MPPAMASTSAFLNVQNIDASLAFYKALGFKVTYRGKTDDGKLGWCDLDMDGAGLGLGSIPSNMEDEYQAWVSTPLGAGVVVYVTVDDVDRVYAKAQKVNAKIEIPLQDRSYGRVFTLNDPDGYTVSFITEEKPRPRRRAKAKKAVAKRARK